MATTIVELESRLSRVEKALERLGAPDTGPRIGMTLEEVKRDLEEHPRQEWTEKMWADFTAIVGIGEGPADLSENKLRYLYDDPE